MNNNTSNDSYNGLRARQKSLDFSWYRAVKSKFLRKMAVVNLTDVFCFET